MKTGFEAASRSFAGANSGFQALAAEMMNSWLGRNRYTTGYTNESHTRKIVCPLK